MLFSMQIKGVRSLSYKISILDICPFEIFQGAVIPYGEER